MAFCRSCGNEIHKEAFVCIHCGVMTDNKSNNQTTEEYNGVVLGIIGLCFSLFVPPVTWVCSGIGLNYAIKAKHEIGKVLNSIALGLSLIRILIYLILIASIFN